MKYIFNCLIFITTIIALSFMMQSCSDDDNLPDDNVSNKGGLLRLSVGFGPTAARLAELPNTGEIGNSIIDGKDYGLKNIGLYVYYSDDYKRGDLSKPYVRNLECTVKNGELVAVIPDGADDTDSRIFIYEEMTVVAFYPYNSTMSEEENYFSTKADEEKYPITKQDYSQQYYIPYRAQTETNPTTAYFTQLTLYPKHTYKVEIVVVSKDGNLPAVDNNLKILPGIDPVDNTDLNADGKREAWFDASATRVLPNGGGGSDVAQYVAYIWTGNGNDIKKGDVLLQSGNLMLIASQDVKVNEQFIYRYGYNMSTGEIFIPTSSDLVHDRPTLAGLHNANKSSYQVCDIDLADGGPWQPIDLIGGRFDGGGHKIENMNVIQDDEGRAGLFGQIQANTNVANVNLIKPQITVTTTEDVTYVGALCGKLNNILSEADKNDLIASYNFPPGLSEVVKQALIKDLLATLVNSQSNIIACRVEEPTITVTGKAPHVGTIVGQAGDKDMDGGNYKSRIWDTYSLGGKIVVNAADHSMNTGGYVGGFCGLNNGTITLSYATINDIDFKMDDGAGGTAVEKSNGFATMGNLFSLAEGGYISDSFSILPNVDAGVTTFSSGWPSWSVYTGIWPINNIGWMSSIGSDYWYNLGIQSAPTYPILQWERR